MNDDPLSRRDEFLRHGIPRDVFIYYARKAQDLRQQAFRDALAAVLRCVGLQSGYCGNPTSWRGEMTVRNSSRPIARVFRATAAPGCRNELLEKFHSSSATLVNSKVGCLKYRILEPVDASASEVVFESIWRDLDAIKAAFGDAWQQSYLPEGYSALMTAYSVHHFLVSESSIAK